MNRISLNLLILAIGLSASSIATAQSTSLQDFAGGLTDQSVVTTVYSAKEFITMDPNQPRAEAVAVRDGKFVAVGTLAEVRTAVGEEVDVDRSFADQVVIAGFVEQHVHPVLAALTMNTKVISIEDWDAIDGFSPAVRDEQSYQRRLAEAIDSHSDKSKPFISWGYHHYFHGDLSRTTLDRMAPDFPVVIWHRSCHEFFLNTAALNSIGVNENLIQGFTASQREQLSFEKGHFYEQGAMAILGKLAPILASPAQFRNGLEFTETYYHRNGITVCCEPGGFFSKPMQEAINAVYSDSDTPFHHFFIADGKSFVAREPDDPKALIADTEQVLNWGVGRTSFLPNQVKLLSDGAIYSQLMMMKDGYTDGHHGAWIMDPPIFDYAFQAYWDAGYQIHIHNNGDAGLDVLLASLKKAINRNPRNDHRTVLVHFGFANPDQVRQWAELGGIVSSNPYYVTALAGRYAKLGLGPERSKNMVPMGEVVKNRISFSFHSDMPMAPAKPLQLVWAGVNRLTAEGEVAGPEHRVTVEQALQAVTIDAAFSIQQEHRIGSIQVGKNANLTVLNESPFDVEPMQIKDIGIWGTMLEGRVQPAKQSQADVGSIPSKLSESMSLAEMRRLNALDLARYDAPSNPKAAYSAGSCGPGCSCGMVGVLGTYIVSQFKIVADFGREDHLSQD